MNAKKVNWLFLSIIVSSLLLNIAFVVFDLFEYLDIIGQLLVIQATNFVPCIIFFIIALKKGTKAKELLPMKRIKVSTVLLTILFTYLCMPLTMLINMISMIFVENEVLALDNQLISVPIILAVLVVGIIAPVSEEFCFRGMIYHGYRKSGRIIGSMVLSALLFGMMHLNFNQMSYAFAVGILCCLLVESTGNILMPMLFHAVFNTHSTVLSFVSFRGLDSEIPQESLREVVESMGIPHVQGMLMIILLYTAIAVGTTTLAILVLNLIAKIEKRKDHFKTIWVAGKGASKAKLGSVPLYIAGVLCLSIMILGVVAQYLT